MGTVTHETATKPETKTLGETKEPAGEVLDVAKVVAEWDPFNMLGCRVTKTSVQKAIAKETFAQYEVDSVRTTRYHARRIAYLVTHGWDDPIHVDVGCGPYGGHFEIVDGNHRLCAAVIRGDKSIKASTSGLVDIIRCFEFKG